MHTPVPGQSPSMTHAGTPASTQKPPVQRSPGGHSWSAPHCPIEVGPSGSITQ